MNAKQRRKVLRELFHELNKMTKDEMQLEILRLSEVNIKLEKRVHHLENRLWEAEDSNVDHCCTCFL